MDEQPLSLLRTAAPTALIALAEPLISPGRWPAFERAAGGGEVSTTALTVTSFCADSGFYSHVYASPRRSLRLIVEVCAHISARLCAQRFGGASAGDVRPRGGRIERAMAAQVAAAVLADLPPGDWSVAEGAASDPSCIEVRLQDGDARTLARLSLFGLRATAAPAPADDWFERLRALAMEVRLPVRSVLARPLLSAGEIARLRVGDVIPIRAPDRVALLSGQRRLATGTLTELDGHAAVRLEPLETDA